MVVDNLVDLSDKYNDLQYRKGVKLSGDYG